MTGATMLTVWRHSNSTVDPAIIFDGRATKVRNYEPKSFVGRSRRIGSGIDALQLRELVRRRR